jgi:hypothetical protein
MSLATIEWQMIGCVTAIIVFFYGFLRNFKSDVKERILELHDFLEQETYKIREESKQQFEFIRHEIREFRSDVNSDLEFIGDQVNEIRADLGDFRKEMLLDITDIKERLSFLEAATLYTMPLEPAQLNPRSQAAREMWKKRKQKGLEKKE